MLLAERVAGIAEGTGRHAEQPAVAVIRPPRQQRRVVGQESLQTFDVVVVNDASGLRYRPFEPSAKTLAHLRGEVLPTRVPVIGRRYALSEIVEAYRYAESGHKLGHVAVNVAPAT